MDYNICICSGDEVRIIHVNYDRCINYYEGCELRRIYIEDIEYVKYYIFAI